MRETSGIEIPILGENILLMEHLTTMLVSTHQNKQGTDIGILFY